MGKWATINDQILYSLGLNRKAGTARLLLTPASYRGLLKSDSTVMGLYECVWESDFQNSGFHSSLHTLWTREDQYPSITLFHNNSSSTMVQLHPEHTHATHKNVSWDSVSAAGTSTKAVITEIQLDSNNEPFQFSICVNKELQIIPIHVCNRTCKWSALTPKVLHRLTDKPSNPHVDISTYARPISNQDWLTNISIMSGHDE